MYPTIEVSKTLFVERFLAAAAEILEEGLASHGTPKP